MEDMKFDMSGAAAVLGTFETLGHLKPKLHVIGLVPLAAWSPRCQRSLASRWSCS